MTNTRAVRLGAFIAVAWLLLLSVVDVLVPPDISPDPLFALAALVAAAVLSPRATAGFAAAAVVLVVLSGLYNEAWDTAQQWVRLLDVVLVGAAAVVIAEVRVRRERRFGHVATIAEVAQRAVLPTLPAAAADVRVTARYQSAVEDAVVGGDLYDCSLAGARVRFLVGDVRGKGLAAVEQAARVIRAFRQAAATATSLPDVASDVDAYLTPFMGDEDFATALMVDASHRGRVDLLSCGHPPPMLIRPDGTAELLTVPPGLPLGLGAGDESVTLSWEAGDRLLLYTDGLSEARDEQGRFLPLLELAPTLAAAQPDVALDGVLERVRRHIAGGRLSDDLAIVLLENTAGRLTGGATHASGETEW
ncbi:serine/threonine-protein phosphatase [Nocardioides sp. WL0053]|uniref:Serine/threonine-protein phosphatase n=1 Tax=Nocardioides jiangsuensis TaxID=2866161 RepID=A0ABS7RHK9_9ACTN|nr:PP2C family protein-serine/threonine phosphatase [Nocardioides jiangsuensis]MBY9073553.1 serine/threonine-protein phosphatase [Nocardioides jiangsuensis]